MNPPMRKRYNNNSSGGHRRSSNSGGRSYGNRDNNRTGNSGGAPRPRKNFRALQEKFLNQAKDAMGSGDRILAEYYLQHADHYYRMNEEFLAERAEYQEKRNANKKPASKSDDANEKQAQADDDHQDDDDADADAQGPMEDDADFSSSSSSLPAFITSSGKSAKEAGVKVVNLQEWDD